MEQKDNQILNGSIPRALISFFIPCWLGLMFQQLYNTVDTWIVGNFVSTEAVAAVGSVGIAVQFVIGICASIASGAGVVISQHYGAGKFRQLKTDIRSSLLIAVLGGAVLTGLCAAYADEMVVWLKTPADIAPDAETYLFVYFLAMIPNLIYNFGAAILRGMGDSRRPLIVLAVTSLVNIALDVVFVMWLGWDVFGVALATDISQIISAVLILWLLIRQIPDLFDKDEPGESVYGEIFRIGLPTAFQSIMYSGSNVLIQIAINGFSTAVIAAWSIYGKVDCICWMTMSSMGMAVTAFAGQNFGAGNYDRVKKGAWVSSKLLAGSLIVLIAICYGWAPVIFGWFTKDTEVVVQGTRMLRFLTPAYMLYFLIEILPGVLHGCGDVVVPTIASIIGICLIRVLWLRYVLPVYNSMDTVMMSYVVTWALTSVFYVIYFTNMGWLKRCIARAKAAADKKAEERI